MRTRTTLLAIGMMALGGLLGYAAASGRLTSPWQARAAAQPGEPRPAEQYAQNCCSEGTDRGLLLSRADGREARQQGGGQPAKDGKKPNILVIFGDDIGQSNISAYTHGLMGYHTPNIDRIAKEGMLFTDYYAEQSCTAGRSSFITGQCTLRTGLSKVGVPGSPIGLQDRDVTMAQLLKNQGYATGQFGKNHLGDLNKYLPTVHGFDEFFGNLYHLNAEEEPERRTYPQDPKFKEMFGPRGVLRCKATDVDDPTEQPRWATPLRIFFALRTGLYRNDEKKPDSSL